MAESIIQLSEQRGHQQGIEQGRQQGIEQGRQQGIEQGARQMSIESTLLILTERFPDADVPAIEPRLEAIADLNRLRELNRNALKVRSFRAFREALEA